MSAVLSRLPSLPALRVFEAAGRHLSFSRAAEELHVTQAAVSHQIRALEDQIGQPLFHRSTRRLALTPAGRQLLPAATLAFNTLARALADLDRAGALLTVTTTPFFGARWLAPRLRRFSERHPGIEVAIRHTQAVLDLAAEGIDIAIRSGRGEWPGLEAEMLVPSVLLPVAAPDCASRLPPALDARLRDAVLLHDECRDDWAEWLALAGLDPSLARTGPVFDDEGVVVEAALAGQGIALLMRPLVAKELAAGALVPVLDLAMTETSGYHLVYPPGARALPKVETFRTFLLEEARRG